MSNAETTNLSVNQTWTKKNRIRKSRDFRIIQSKGWKVRTQDFLFVFLPPSKVRYSTGEETRVGLVVSKKVGNAVVRNQVKRRIREACRHAKGCLREPVDLVVIAFMTAKFCDQSSVNAQINLAYTKIDSRMSGVQR